MGVTQLHKSIFMANLFGLYNSASRMYQIANYVLILRPFDRSLVSLSQYIRPSYLLSTLSKDQYSILSASDTWYWWCRYICIWNHIILTDFDTVILTKVLGTTVYIQFPGYHHLTTHYQLRLPVAISMAIASQDIFGIINTLILLYCYILPCVTLYGLVVPLLLQ